MLIKTTPTGIGTKTQQLVHPSVRCAERTGARDGEWSADPQTPALPPRSWSCSKLLHFATPRNYKSKPNPFWSNVESDGGKWCPKATGLRLEGEGEGEGTWTRPDNRVQVGAGVCCAHTGQKTANGGGKHPTGLFRSSYRLIWNQLSPQPASTPFHVGERWKSVRGNLAAIFRAQEQDCLALHSPAGLSSMPQLPHL